MTETTLREDKRFIRIVCASMLGTQVVMTLLMLSFASPLMTTMSEMTKQFSHIIASPQDQDESVMRLEKEIKLIKSSLEEVKWSMKKVEMMPATVTNIKEELIKANQDIAWLTDNTMSVRRKTEKYTGTMPLMESSISYLYQELSTMNLEMKKIRAQLQDTHEPLSCVLTLDGNLIKEDSTYQGESFVFPPKTP